MKSCEQQLDTEDTFFICSTCMLKDLWKYIMLQGTAQGVQARDKRCSGGENEEQIETSL